MRWLVPSHECPGGQGKQVSRVLVLSTLLTLLVYEPVWHVRHGSLWPAVAYLLSAPQSVQLLEPGDAYVPASHCTCTLVPLQLWPYGHSVHVSRVLVLSTLLVLLV